MGQIGETLAPAANLSMRYAERLLQGVAAGQFARLARPGGVQVQSNHPAFVFGHLALYPQRVMSALGLALGAAQMPDSYAEVFKDGLECRDDAEGRIYPPMSDVTARFFDAYRAAIAATAAAEDRSLLSPNPAEGRMREMFPTIGAAANFYLSGHVQMHLGQVSAWRRAMGMPPA